jgi:hypothetical protein
MLHACLCTICFVFCYTSWHFYAFSGTNLLTRFHSASSLFSAVFVFQKSYPINILGIGRNKSRTSYFSQTKNEDRRRAEGGPEGYHTRGWRAPLLATPLGGEPPLVHFPTPPLRLYKASRWKTLDQSAIFQKKSRSSAAATDEFRGTEVSVPAPC